MNETPFEQFITLVKVDQQINAINATIADLEKKNQDHNILEQQHQSELEAIKTKLTHTKKEVDAKELEMKILDQQESEKKKRLDAIANHKEYQLIKAEIDQLKKSQHELEDVLMGAWNSLETIKKEYESAVVQYDKQQKIINEQISQNKEKIVQHQEEINHLAQDRISKERAVPAEWLEKYAVMRTKVTNPVVPVINGSCSACFYKVLAQDMQFLKHRRLVQCKDCFRLLYLPEAQLETSSTGQNA